MTILIVAAGADGVLLAADTKVSSQVGSASQKSKKKLSNLDGPVLAATGGYSDGVTNNLLPFAHATQRARPDEPNHTTEFVDDWLHKVGYHLAKAGDAMAEGVKVDAGGLYSIVAGVDSGGQFNWRFTEHGSGRRDTGGPGSFLVVGTDTEVIKRLVMPVHQLHLGRSGSINADVWVSQVVAVAAEAFPDTIGFPVDLGIVRGKGLGVTTTIAAPLTTGRPEFTLAI